MSPDSEHGSTDRSTTRLPASESEKMTRWESFEEKSATLFLGGGVLLVGFAALLGYQAFTNEPAPEDIFAGAGFALGFLGLLGLYPALADRSPWFARAGAVFAALGAIGFAVTFVVSIGQFAGAVPAEIPAWVAALQILSVVGLVPGYLAFGVASLRTDAHSRTLGLLLLAPAIIFSLNLATAIALSPENPEFTAGPVVFASGQTLALLAIGYVLRTEGVPTDRERVEPSVGPTGK